jgi:hypothetical protein
MKKTKKAFREYLNQVTKSDPNFKHNQYGQRVREYGDYIYSQDKVLFNVMYQEWLSE